MTLVSSSLICLGLLAAGAPEIHFDRPGWYHLELRDDQALILKVSESTSERLVCEYQGVLLEVRVAEIRTLLPLAEYRKRHPANPRLSVEQEMRIRESIDEIGRRDTASVSTQYTFLSGQFPQCRPIVHESLSHRSVRVRRILAKLLGEFGDPRTDVDPLQRLLGDSRPTVRLAAIKALRNLGPASLNVLADYARKESKAKFRRAAVRAMEKWNDDRAVDPLVDLLSSEKDRSVRSTIVSALKQLTGANFGDNAVAWRMGIKALRGRDPVPGIDSGVKEARGR